MMDPIKEAMFDAMCIWEEFLSDWQGSYPGYDSYREANGACETRDRVIELVPHCQKAWQAAKAEGYEDPFDWEFVPRWLKAGTTAVTPGTRELTITTDPEIVGRMIARGEV